MKRLDSVENEMRGIVTYQLSNGNRVDLDADAVRRHGAAEVLRWSGYGHLLPTERVRVIQDGQMVGTLPPDFDPASISSKTFLYEPRPGDFRRAGDTWVASPMLGPGDLEAIPGFRPA